MDHEQRVARLRERLGEVGADGTVVSERENVAYLTGFEGSAGWLIVTGDAAVLFTDSRYSIQAEQQAVGVSVETPKNGIADGVAKWINDMRGRPVIAFESAQLSVDGVERFRPKLKRAAFVPEAGLVETLREVKDDEELELIRQAVSTMDAAFAKVLATATAGMTERDFAVELEHEVRLAGGRESFPTICARGRHSAMPHYQPAECPFVEGDFILVDCGARVKGYCSDMTRTVVLGEPREERQSRIYEAVRAAQLAAIAAIKPGVEGKAPDEAAKAAIKEAGFEEDCYDHGLGHGIGRHVHEGPRMGKNAEEELKPGQVLTVEPGIYIKDFGGVRIEDVVVIAEEGCEVLTQTPKHENLPSVG